ncbi:hypothetical protein [Ensifer adhaerens]|uniref:hypothetical protein n=1 Tax=Ensifer adhaerens TaxID=106592 RepID=UPI0015695C87|nr:hypothetical protein [Ensifer adhaerens]
MEPVMQPPYGTGTQRRFVDVALPILLKDKPHKAFSVVFTDLPVCKEARTLEDSIKNFQLRSVQIQLYFFFHVALPECETKWDRTGRWTPCSAISGYRRHWRFCSDLCARTAGNMLAGRQTSSGKTNIFTAPGPEFIANMVIDESTLGKG